MTALAKLPAATMADICRLAPSLKRLPSRVAPRPRLAPQWPCLQPDQQADTTMIGRLADIILDLPDVTACDAPHDPAGRGFALDETMARGQPEAFLGGSCWVNLRADGSLHLNLRPEWAQKVIDKGWATVHPFARYMAGAVPPQSLVVFAPLGEEDIRVVARILAAAHGYAIGRIAGVVLPDTRW